MAPIVVLLLVPFRQGAAGAQDEDKEAKPLVVTVTVGFVDNAEVVGDSAMTSLKERGWRGVVSGGPDDNSLAFELTADSKFIVGTLEVDDVRVSGRKFVDQAAPESVLRSATAELVDTLVDKYQAALSPSTLIVQCDPRGATLKLDRIGYLTCGPNQVSHGRHAVTASNRGYQSSLYSVTVPAGGTETLLVSLVRDEKSRTMWYLAAGLVGAGGLVGGVGIANILTDEGRVKDRQQQPEEKNRAKLGIGLAVAGGVMLAAGVVVGVLAHRRNAETAVMPVPVGDGGGGIVWGGSF